MSGPSSTSRVVEVRADGTVVLEVTVSPPVIDPGPVDPPPVSASAVRIGAAVYPLAGVDAVRGKDQLVALLPDGVGSVTTTNEWGAEVGVVAGVVASSRDRQGPPRLTTGTVIPAGGYVLSGHGLARDWLLRHAAVGARVELTDEQVGPVTPPVVPQPPAGMPWFGASGPEAANGSLAAQLASRTVAVGGTWADNSIANHVSQRSIATGGEWGAWSKPLDLAVGGVFKREGQTWGQAAAGAYEGQWVQCLNRVVANWGQRDPGLLYLRFCHEFNGSFMDHWKISAAERADYVAAFRRWVALQRRIIPAAKVLWPVNDGSSVGIDIRSAWPGDDVVDMVSVDSYNQWPHITDASGWASKSTQVDGFGAPVGVEAWRRFAASKGKPMCVSEWSNNGDRNGQGGGGESPFYVQAMHDWAVANAGTGAGQVAYMVLFNLWPQFQMHPTTQQPQTWDRYRSIF